MRLFVAAYPPAAAFDDLADRIAGMHIGRAAEAGVNARVAARPLWHVTLTFLGDVDDLRRDDAAVAVDKAAARFDGVPPTLWLAGGGTFGRGRFTTLWGGLGGAGAALTSLAGTGREGGRGARLPFDHKPFRPHVTIARPGKLTRSQIAEDVAALTIYVGPQWTLTDIALVSSHLGPNPSHEILRRAHLPGTA